MLRWEQFGVGDDKPLGEKHICIDEWRRPSALDCVAIMGSSPEERFDRIARIAKNLLKVSITLITFIDMVQDPSQHFGDRRSPGVLIL
tara:strand:+ start:2450 stop:2713 length:264 start_codon:yes stop_codon:yes gene_type:complete